MIETVRVPPVDRKPPDRKEQYPAGPAPRPEVSAHFDRAPLETARTRVVPCRPETVAGARATGVGWRPRTGRNVDKKSCRSKSKVRGFCPDVVYDSPYTHHPPSSKWIVFSLIPILGQVHPWFASTVRLSVARLYCRTTTVGERDPERLFPDDRSDYRIVVAVLLVFRYYVRVYSSCITSISVL